MPVADDDYRIDGTPKGPGFLGALIRPDGRIATEASTWVKIDGKDVLIPLLVPTLSHKEIRSILNDEKKEAIVRKALRHAVTRINDGLSPFKEERGREPLDKEERKSEYEEGSESRRRSVIVQIKEAREV